MKWKVNEKLTTKLELQGDRKKQDVRENEERLLKGKQEKNGGGVFYKSKVAKGKREMFKRT